MYSIFHTSYSFDQKAPVGQIHPSVYATSTSVRSAEPGRGRTNTETVATTIVSVCLRPYSASNSVPAPANAKPTSLLLRIISYHGAWS